MPEKAKVYKYKSDIVDSKGFMPIGNKKIRVKIRAFDRVHEIYLNGEWLPCELSKDGKRFKVIIGGV